MSQRFYWLGLAVERGWLCLVLVLTKQNSGRVSLDRVVSVLLVNTNSVPAEALIVGRSEEHFWLSAGLSFYILIVTSQLLSEYYQTTEDTIKVRICYSWRRPNSSVQNFLVTTSGGVLHIISGWETLSFYSSLVSV